MNHSFKVLVHKMVSKKDELTHDEEYEKAEQRFLQHMNACMQLLQSMETYYQSLQKMAVTSCEFSEQVQAFYATTELSPEPKAVQIFSKSMASVDQRTRAITTKELQDQAIVEWTEYCGFLQTLHNKIAERRQLLQDFDYYKKKVRDLKEKPSRDETSLPRNEAKLYTAETAYDTLNQELVDVFNSVSNDANNAYNAVFVKVMSCVVSVNTENAQLTSSLQDVANNPGAFGCEIREPKYKPLKLHYGVSPLPTNKVSRFFPRVGGAAPNTTTTTTTNTNTNTTSVNAIPITEPTFPTTTAPPPPTTAPTPTTTTTTTTTKANKSQKQVRGLFDFEATNEDELSFRVGDVMDVVDEPEEGWWLVESKEGKRGVIPYNYVEVL